MKSPLAAQGIMDRWNRIGVYGDGSCPEIVVYTHCRNCPVYEETARRFLDRSLPEEYRKKLHEELVWEQEARGDLPLVFFRLGNDWFALPSRCCAEITEPKKVHHLPRRSGPLLLGLVNIRGEIQLCVSLRRLLGIDVGVDQAIVSGFPRMVLVENGKRCWSFPVDELHSVRRIRQRDVQPVSGLELVTGIVQMEEKTVQCLDENAFFALLDRSLYERG